MIYDYYLDRWDKEEKESCKVLLGKLKKEVRNKIKKSKDEIRVFYPSIDDFYCFPQYSVLIKILFTLKKPYTSKDEEEFYLPEWVEKKNNDRGAQLLENPIVRDRFTGLPIVRSSTWKGHLRFAAEKVKWSDDTEKKSIIERLFGSEPRKKQEMLKGRLYFFTTFFEDEAEKDIITPLKRDTRTPTSKGPIPLEVMKPEKDGYFYLLYFPYPKKGKSEIREEVKKDLTFLGEALKLMFYTYGFSAKKTSGFGVIEKEIKEGEILLKFGGGFRTKKIENLDELNSEIISLFGETGGPNNERCP